MKPLLELENVTYTYHGTEGETPALTDISFSVEKGEFIAIVGPSGCGKSTLLSLICGLLSPEDGLLKINGKNPKENPDSIGYMLQHDHLFEWRSVSQNVILGLAIRSTDLNTFPMQSLRPFPAECGNVPPWSALCFWNRSSSFWMSLSLPWIIRPF